MLKAFEGMEGSCIHVIPYGIVYLPRSLGYKLTVQLVARG